MVNLFHFTNPTTNHHKDDEFSDLQNYFLDKYWMEFEDIEENKFIYMDIFQEYVSKTIFFFF